MPLDELLPTDHTSSTMITATASSAPSISAGGMLFFFRCI